MRPTFRLVPDFILPHLEASTYGTHLQWENKQNGSFKISRIHQSSESWNEQCIEVYKAWSVHKKLWISTDPKRITKAKHRLITALRRNPRIETLEKESTYYRFRIVDLNIAERKSLSVASDKKFKLPSKEVKKEIKEYSEIVNNRENYDFFSNIELKEQSDFFSFSNLETMHLQTSQLDTVTFPKQLFVKPDDTSEEMYNDEEKSTFSDKCCCDILLDNYLCNQKCIWHGMPP